MDDELNYDSLVANMNATDVRIIALVEEHLRSNCEILHHVLICELIQLLEILAIAAAVPYNLSDHDLFEWFVDFACRLIRSTDYRVRDLVNASLFAQLSECPTISRFFVNHSDRVSVQSYRDWLQLSNIVEP